MDSEVTQVFIMGFAIGFGVMGIITVYFLRKLEKKLEKMIRELEKEVTTDEKNIRQNTSTSGGRYR